jgi:hypothetical protein
VHHWYGETGTKYYFRSKTIIEHVFSTSFFLILCFVEARVQRNSKGETKRSKTAARDFFLFELHVEHDPLPRSVQSFSDEFVLFLAFVPSFSLWFT